MLSIYMEFPKFVRRYKNKIFYAQYPQLDFVISPKTEIALLYLIRLE